MLDNLDNSMMPNALILCFCDLLLVKNSIFWKVLINWKLKDLPVPTCLSFYSLCVFKHNVYSDFNFSYIVVVGLVFWQQEMKISEVVKFIVHLKACRAQGSSSANHFSYIQTLDETLIWHGRANSKWSISWKSKF